MNVSKRTLLRIDASMRRQKSVSRMLADEMVAALGARKPGISVINRDLAAGIGIVNAAWIEAERTSEENRTPTSAPFWRSPMRLSRSCRQPMTLSSRRRSIISAFPPP